MFRRSYLPFSTQKVRLFTPGPLSVSPTVKATMLTDYGSRDTYFMETIQVIRDKVLELGNLSKDTWTTIPVPGSGTAGVEAAISSATPRGENVKALVVKNGAYGLRHTNICKRLNIPVDMFEYPEGEKIDLGKFKAAVQAQKETPLNTFVSVHSETSTGVLNDVESLHKIVKDCYPNCTTIVDAMSSFGGVPMQVDDVCDVLVTSMNKCIQSVPGASLVVARRNLVESWKGQSRSFVLDVNMLYETLEKTKQFPFTPATHVLVAFRQALLELEQEGGVEARYRRYQENANTVIDGMLDLGFELFIKDRNDSHFGPIIISFLMPEHKKFEFKWFYDGLKDKGCVIYPGKTTTSRDTFRIGCIGDLHKEDFEYLLKCVTELLDERNISLKK